MLIFAWIVLSVKTAQRNLYYNRGEHHCTRLRGHWLLSTICVQPLDLCPAAACIVDCWLMKNKVVLYGNQEARIIES